MNSGIRNFWNDFWGFMMDENRDSGLYVNLGCGPVQPSGWVNVDFSNRARLVKAFSRIDALLVKAGILPPTEFSRDTTVFDIRKTFPFETASVKAFFAGELLEHLLPGEAENLMKECFRTLVPGGKLRVNVPDNYRFWKRYCNSHEEMLKKSTEEWGDEYSKKWIGMFWNDICTSRPWFNSMGHFHKWAYDEVSLTLLFKRANFINISRKGLYESEIPGIEAVEKRAFLVAEASKPQ